MNAATSAHASRRVARDTSMAPIFKIEPMNSYEILYFNHDVAKKGPSLSLVADDRDSLETVPEVREGPTHVLAAHPHIDALAAGAQVQEFAPPAAACLHRYFPRADCQPHALHRTGQGSDQGEELLFRQMIHHVSLKLLVLRLDPLELPPEVLVLHCQVCNVIVDFLIETCERLLYLALPRKLFCFALEGVNCQNHLRLELHDLLHDIGVRKLPQFRRVVLAAVHLGQNLVAKVTDRRIVTAQDGLHVDVVRINASALRHQDLQGVQRVRQDEVPLILLLKLLVQELALRVESLHRHLIVLPLLIIGALRESPAALEPPDLVVEQPQDVPQLFGLLRALILTYFSFGTHPLLHDADTLVDLQERLRELLDPLHQPQPFLLAFHDCGMLLLNFFSERHDLEGVRLARCTPSVDFALGTVIGERELQLPP
mmetsp:Transcript_2058/g.6661  ORF Transcript_2058/g.6661 Transcript_2058/m.6661 type:complete len:428 (-) Transcript_2058:1193-2476(-)